MRTRPAGSCAVQRNVDCHGRGDSSGATPDSTGLRFGAVTWVMEFLSATPSSSLAAALDDVVHVWRFARGHDWRAILAGYLDCTTADLDIGTGAFGKPCLVGGELDFNLSHSGAVGLLALARGCALGVDVERPRALRRRDALLRRCFDVAERLWLEAADDRLLLRAWTVKEALLKAHGRGIAYGMRRVRTCPGNDWARLAEVEGEAGPASRWVLTAFSADIDHDAALVTAAPRRAVSGFQAGC